MRYATIGVMWGESVVVDSLRCDVIAEQRERLGLTEVEAVRRTLAYLSTHGAGARDGIALTGSGFGWATERSCRRAIDDLEGGRRRIKEAQYVNALLAVLGLERQGCWT
jgi:hypothetical protein